ncbi:hypothetical protein LLEC1_03286 [Akanthomyces lecanii]|uniref:Zeta toxin domain-containing protein n=1 Tax=Cordyceps confragosa TaxID=2714763 RepID=A0A179IJ35_CORDF|nr:hypothetical protein LLEC1_03286 [Akanthomyces lecanii]
MPPPPDLSSYRLGDADSQRIFQEEILPAEFPTDGSGAAPSPSTRKKPLAVLAVGQTGAGKTLLAPAIIQALGPSAKPAHFIADTYKTYHPHACRHPDDFCELAALFRAAGYRVEVVVLAVPEALSRMGILSRFYDRKPEAQSRNLPVRLTPVKVHDDSYAGLLHAAQFLDESDAADQVVVVRRGNLVAYGWERESGAPAAIAKAVEKERQSQLTDAEMDVALDDAQKLSMHEDAKEQLQQIRELMTPLISDDAQDVARSSLVPLAFAQKDGDERASNVLRLGYA